MRKLWIGLGIFAALAVAGLAVAFLAIDAASFRGPIETRAEQALGREVQLGELGLSFWPFGLHVDALELGARPGEGAERMLVADGVTVGARLWPLVSGRLEVTSIVVDSPRLEVARGADGSWNVEHLVEAGQAETDPGSTVRGAEERVVVHALRVTDGVVVVRDAASEWTLEEVALDIDELGSDRPIDFALGARLAGQPTRFELAGRIETDSSDATVLNDIVAKLDGHPIGLRGTMRLLEEVPTVDLEIPKASLPADVIAKLMSLAGFPSPVAFSSDVPVELEASVRGPVGAGREPEIRARARLQDFTLAHPSLAKPVENVGADVTFDGARLELAELGATIGSSDVRGRVTVLGFDPPRAEFDLQSRQADFDELFSFLVEDDESASTSSAGASTSDPTAELEMRGRLVAERGRFASLAFSDLDATVSYRDGRLTLDPLAARLYEGTFRGAITSRLMEDVPPFTVEGTAESVDVGVFLKENLGLADVLDGRLGGSISTRGAGTEIEQMLPGLAGAGSITVVDGSIGKLNVLETLAGVSGLLGESTLQKLSGKLAADGTTFGELASKVRVEGGRLYLDGLVLEAAEFRLGGDAAIDMLAGNMDGSFRLAFSPEVSAALEAEDSLAAKVFYSTTTKRVELPFTLSGPWSAPKPSIDLEGVARERARDELRDRIAEELAERLGARPEDPGPSKEPVVGPSGSTASPPLVKTHEDLAVEFTGTRWRGPILARDLEVSGLASGIDIARVSLVVSDAAGRVVDQVDQLDDVHRWVEATTDRSGRASVPWKYKVDGKRLLGGTSPFNVMVTVANGAGESAVAVLPVAR